MYSFYFYAIKNVYYSLGGEINHILSRSKTGCGGQLATANVQLGFYSFFEMLQIWGHHTVLFSASN